MAPLEGMGLFLGQNGVMVPSPFPVSSLTERLLAARQEVLAVAQRHGARNLRIFGSVARGLDQPESDLDLLVDFEKGQSLLETVALRLELQALLGCRIDLAEPEQLHPRIREHVIAEARPL